MMQSLSGKFLLVLAVVLWHHQSSVTAAPMGSWADEVEAAESNGELSDHSMPPIADWMKNVNLEPPKRGSIPTWANDLVTVKDDGPRGTSWADEVEDADSQGLLPEFFGLQKHLTGHPKTKQAYPTPEGSSFSGAFSSAVGGMSPGYASSLESTAESPEKQYISNGVQAFPVQREDLAVQTVSIEHEDLAVQTCPPDVTEMGVQVGQQVSIGLQADNRPQKMDGSCQASFKAKRRHKSTQTDSNLMTAFTQTDTPPKRRESSIQTTPFPVMKEQGTDPPHIINTPNKVDRGTDPDQPDERNEQPESEDDEFYSCDEESIEGETPFCFQSKSVINNILMNKFGKIPPIYMETETFDKFTRFLQIEVDDTTKKRNEMIFSLVELKSMIQKFEEIMKLKVTIVRFIVALRHKSIADIMPSGRSKSIKVGDYYLSYSGRQKVRQKLVPLKQSWKAFDEKKFDQLCDKAWSFIDLPEDYWEGPMSRLFFSMMKLSQTLVDIRRNEIPEFKHLIDGFQKI